MDEKTLNNLSREKAIDLLDNQMDYTNQLQQRIDKAIDYIDRHIRFDDEYPAYMEMLIEERDELLEILKGGKNE